MGRRKDISGQRFGRLVAIEHHSRPSFWSCRCDCGEVKPVDGHHLRSGAVRSCGCLVRSRGGVTVLPGYQVWTNMIARCQDPSNKYYANYGGRGIKVCDRWQDPSAFLSDMGPRPAGMTLERRENEGDYEPSNCRWATRLVQANNKRNVPLVEFDGRRQSIAEWAREIGISAETLRSRVKRGVSIGEALSTPPKSAGRRSRISHIALAA